MPQYRALKTFRSTAHGPSPTHIVRTGVVLTMNEKEAAKLNRQTPMVEPYGGPREAPENKSLPGAPFTQNAAPTDPVVEGAGDDEGNAAPPPSEESSKPTSSQDLGRRVGGRVRRLSAALQGQASRKKT